MGWMNILHNLQTEFQSDPDVHPNFKGPKLEVDLEALKYMYKRTQHLTNQYIIY